jgi:hypothetical protein
MKPEKELIEKIQVCIGRMRKALLEHENHACPLYSTAVWVNADISLAIMEYEEMKKRKTP